MIRQLCRALVSTFIVALFAACPSTPAHGTSAPTVSLPPAAAPAAISDSVDLVDKISGRFTALTLVGSRLYAREDLDATEALSVFDISSGIPQRLARIELPEGASAVTVSGNRAYTAVLVPGAYHRLLTFDISDLQNPKQIGSSEIPDFYRVGQIHLIGHFAYMIFQSGGLVIFDIADINNIAQEGVAIGASNLVVRGNRAYMVGGNTGFSIFDISNPASPQLLSSASTIDGLHIAIVGNLAYLSGAGLMVVDISDPLNLRLRGTYPILGMPGRIVVLGTRAYIAVAGQGLLIIDVGNPDAPFLLGAYDSGQSTFDLQVANGLAYIASGGAGLLTVDISNVDRPRLSLGLAFAGVARDMRREGNVVYVTEEINNGSDVLEGRLHIFDATNPAAPILRGTYRSPLGANGLQVVGGVAYIATGIGLQIIDVRDPASPRKLGGLTTGLGGVTEVQVVGTRAYLSGSGMPIIDVSNPRRPVLLGRALQGRGVMAMDVVGNLAYVAAHQDGIYIVDIANPTAPATLSLTDTGIDGTALSVRVAGTSAYVADTNGLLVFDVSNAAAPQLRGSYPTLDQAVDVDVAGDLIFLADGHGGVRILDGASSFRPALVSAFDGGIGAGRIHVSEGRGYVAGRVGSSGTHALEIDLSTLARARLRDTIPGLGQALGAQVVGNLAYIAAGQDGLQILDISNPGHPQYVGSYAEYVNNSSLMMLDKLQVVGNRVYAMRNRYGLTIFDVANPAAPRLLNTVQVDFNGFDRASFSVVGTTAYIGSEAGPFSIFDVSNPAQPKLLSQRQLGIVHNFTVVGGMIYIAGVNGGFRIVDARNPAEPVLRGSYACVAYDVAVANGLAYLTCGGNGSLRILDVGNPGAPTLRGQLLLTGDPERIQLAGSLAYVGHGGSLKIVDIRNPAAPTLRATFDTAGYVYQTQPNDPLLYVAAGVGGLYTLWYRPSTTVSVGPAGGTLSSTIDQTRYSIPSGAFSPTTQFTHVPRYQNTLPTTGPLIGIGHAFEVSATLSTSTQPITPSLPFTITLTYSDAERGSAIAQTLGLYVWENDQWVRIPTSKVHVATKTITANTKRIGLFAALAETRRTYLPITHR